ncbi:MAG TPA: outer membrane beta-barrel family protein, partial [Chitinophagaceae bacterium]|nr:outer membrane beta-barrel family protein [Chitinophagaceae bacterium]
RNKRINIFSTYNYSYGLNEQRINFKRTVLDSLFDQQGKIHDLRRAHNFKVGADYFIDKKNTIGVMVNGVLADPNSTNYSKTNISNTTTGIVDRLLIADNETDMKRHNINFNLNYNYIDPKGTSLSINADRGQYDINSDQVQRNYYYDPSGQTGLGSVINHMLSPADIDISSIKADYEQNFQKGKLSIGAKTAWIKTDNDFGRYNVHGSVEDLDKDRSNHFIYKENINSAYVNFNRQYKGVMLQIGLRVENTVSEGVSTGLKFNGSTYVPNESSFKRSYTDLFPSAAITFNKNPLKQWNITYSRRIDRPAYQDLNPFEFKLDEYSFMKGNINLRPQYTNSVGLTHTYKYKLNIGLNYSHVKDMFTQLIDTAEKSKAFVSKRNLATQDIISLSISYPFQYKTYTLFGSINSNYSMYKANFGDGRKVDLDAFGFNLFLQNSLKFAKVWTAELSGFFNAPTIYNGTFKGKSMYSVDVGLARQIFKNKATLKAAVSDIFWTMRFRAVSDFAGQVMRFNVRSESRQFKLSLLYRFGSATVKPARQRTTGAEDESKRAQQGGVGLGN